MSNYRQALYDIPFSGAVPPNIVGSPLDDDFSASRPGKEISGTPIPGFAELDAKWKTFDPGSQNHFVGIDTRLQMCLLSGHPSKAWVGVYQDLPVPTVIGQTLDHTIYLRSTLAFIDDQPFPYGPLMIGLLLGQDFTNAPDTSTIIAARTLISADNDGDGVPTVSGLIEASLFLTFDGVGIPQARIAAWPAATYYRMRVSQRMDDVASFALTWAVDVAAIGCDWITIANIAETTGAPAPQKSIGFGINAGEGNGTFGAYFDLFRVLEQNFGDLATTIGGTQQLGSV